VVTTKKFDFLLNFTNNTAISGKHGQVYDYADFIKKAADNEISSSSCRYFITCKTYSSGEMGATVVVGTTQRFGI
jgi:glycine dehydrogenase